MGRPRDHRVVFYCTKQRALVSGPVGRLFCCRTFGGAELGLIRIWIVNLWDCGWDGRLRVLSCESILLVKWENSLTATPKGSSCVILVGKNLRRKLWNEIATFASSKWCIVHACSANFEEKWEIQVIGPLFSVLSFGGRRRFSSMIILVGRNPSRKLWDGID